mgnify:CR=1 FL=1
MTSYQIIFCSPIFTAKKGANRAFKRLFQGAFCKENLGYSKRQKKIRFFFAKNKFERQEKAASVTKKGSD